MRNLFPYPVFMVDSLSSFIALGSGLFFILTIIYSLKSMKGKKGIVRYYLYIILTAVAAIGALFANNLVLLVTCWGFLGLTLYLLVNMGEAGSEETAKKSLIIIGGSDVLMILGIGIIYYYAHTMQMDLIRLELNNWLLVFAYICLAIACFTKAGAMPFHSWIPDCAQRAPISVTAYLVGSLDKLLGIYLLTRISLNLFIMNQATNNFLLCIGAFTIIAAVMMALVQHNFKRLLGYHAVSQVGYMILGIGTGNAIGIAGGIFHMFNNAVYKACLFLNAGNIEYSARTTELDKLGGLGKLMPRTYFSCLIASLSISGVPPLNGFVSKWLIYQGLVLKIRNSLSAPESLLGAFCLVVAMFGSGLTLASFMKLLHSVFLGERLNSAKDIKEVPFTMWFPGVILAAICIIFGVFAFVFPLKYFIYPAVSVYQSINSLILLGSWSPVAATLFVLLGLAFGFIIFKSASLSSSIRKDGPFVGGSLTAQKEENMVTGTEFYNTIKEMGLFKGIYKKAEAGCFDLYEQAKKLSFVSGPLRALHNGVLPTYLVWILLGMVGLFLFLLR